MNLGQRIAAAWRAIFNTAPMDISALIPSDADSDRVDRLTRYTILSYAPIWYSVCKMSGHIAAMPKNMIQKKDDEIYYATRRQSNLPDLLNVRANGFMTSMDMIESVQKDAVIDGNGRLGIVRRNGSPVALVPIHPSTAYCFMTYYSGHQTAVSDGWPVGPLFNAVQKWHYITSADGERFILPDEDVIHIKGLQQDGITGIPLWQAAKASIGQGLGAQDYVNRTIENNGVPGLVLEAPTGVLTDDTRAKEFLDTFNKLHTGRGNASRTALLRYGVTANQLSQTGRDGQLLENRKFTRDEAFLWTGDMLFYDGGAGYSNQQERDEAYKSHTLSRWVAKWEAEMNIKLLTAEQRWRGWSIDFGMDSILRGSFKYRLEGYEIARRIGYLSQEEIRQLDNLGPPDPNQNFQNPNTSSPEPAAEAEPEPEPEDETEDEAADVEDLARLSFEADRVSAERRLSGWMKKERSRLMEYARHPAQFLKRAARFYESQTDQAEQIAAELGCPVWFPEHWDMILDAAECQPDELPRRIDQLTANWPKSRPAEILSQRVPANA